MLVLKNTYNLIQIYISYRSYLYLDENLKSLDNINVDYFKSTTYH